MSLDANQNAQHVSVGAGSADSPSKFEGFIPRVFDWAYRLTRNRDQSMDIVQDVFLKWRRQCEVTVPERPEGWLRTVTARRVFELSRSPRRRVINWNLSENTIDARDVSLTGPDLDTLRGDIFAALERLTCSQRDVVLAKVMDGQTFAAIAIDLRISVSTAKTHYLRGLRTLRDTLSPRWKDE